MGNFKDIGQLIQVPIEQVEMLEDDDEKISPFLVASLSEKLQEPGIRNWIPVIVTERVPRVYDVVGNYNILAAMDAAGQEKVWVVVVPDDDESIEQVKILTGQKDIQINICNADSEMIHAALDHLRNQASSGLTKIDINLATERIANASGRLGWKSLLPLTKLKCGITKAKLKAVESVFEAKPEPIEIKPVVLNTASLEELTEALNAAATLPETKLTDVDLILVAQSIAEEPERIYWRDFKPLAKMRHKLTAAKQKGLDQVFKLGPAPAPTPNTVRYLLEGMKVADLKKEAKSRDIPVPKGVKKAELVEMLCR